jgi:hypothetical protein
MIAVMTMSFTRRLVFCEQIRAWAERHDGIFAIVFFVVTFEMMVLYDDLRVVLIRIAHLLHAKGIVARVEELIFVIGTTSIIVIATSAYLFNRYFRQK